MTLHIVPGDTQMLRLVSCCSLFLSLYFPSCLSSLWQHHSHNRGTICFSEWIGFSQWASGRTETRVTERVCTQAHNLAETHLKASSHQYTVRGSFRETNVNAHYSVTAAAHQSSGAPFCFKALKVSALHIQKLLAVCFGNKPKKKKKERVRF